MGWVHALARSLVSDPSAADDLAQETWLRAQGSPPAHPIHGKSLRAWLSVVVRSIARQSWRSEFRRTRREQVASHSEAVPSAHEIVERGSMNRTVAEAVMALDEPYRSTILLRYLDGLPTPAIAERCGVSPDAVRQQLSRGLDQLRARLDREFGGERIAWSALLLPTARAMVGKSSAAARFAGGSFMAKTASSVGTNPILLAIAACIGIAIAIESLVGTGPRRGAPIAAAPESGRPSPSNVVEHEPSTEHDLRAAVAPGSGEGPTHERGERAASTGSIGDRASAHLDSLAQTFLTDQPDIFGLMGALRSMKEK